MKLTYLFSLFFTLVSHFCYAQISYTSSDFTEIGQEYRLSIANLPEGLDFAATGEGIAWDFSELTFNTQQDNEWTNPADAGYQFSWCFLNGIFFGCADSFEDLTNIAQPDFDGFEVNGFGLTDVVTHYKKSNETFEARLIGITPDFGGLSLPFPAEYSNYDTIYQFPIEYGNETNSASEYAIDFSEFGLNFAFNSANERVNTVEGYGSLVTPFGEFAEVLKMKTVIDTENTVIFEDNEVPTELTTIEYKWFSKEYGIPVLTATANVVAGAEVITQVSYIDSIRCIEPQVAFFSTPIQVFSNPDNLDAEVTFTNLTQNADSYFWDFGDGNTSTANNPTHTYDCPGDYMISLAAFNSACEDGEIDSDTLSLPLVVQDTTMWEVYQANESEIAVNLGGANYQWVDCNNNNTPIEGATEQFFAPTQSGSYAVELSRGTCSSELSDCIDIVISDIDLVTEAGLNIYPNPSFGEFIIERSHDVGIMRVDLVSLTGSILSSQIMRDNRLVLHTNMGSGVYFVRFYDERGLIGFKKVVVLE